MNYFLRDFIIYHKPVETMFGSESTKPMSGLESTLWGFALLTLCSPPPLKAIQQGQGGGRLHRLHTYMRPYNDWPNFNVRNILIFVGIQVLNVIPANE